MLPKYHKLMGHEVTVIASLISFDGNGNICFLNSAMDYESRDGYRVKRLNYRKSITPLNKIIRRYKGTYKSIESENPDILFIHGPQFWDIKQVVKYLRKNKGIKVFIDNHADFINSASSWLSRNILHKIIWRYFAKLIEPFTLVYYGVTPLRCDFLRDVYRISSNKIELLVLGADDEAINFNEKDQIRRKIRALLKISEDDFLLITGGKINQNKNIHLLIKAVIELERKNVKLIVFGNANQHMRQQIEYLSKNDNIISIGWIDSKKTYDYFLAADLAVFPGTHSVLREQAVGTGIPGVFKFWKGMDHIDVGGNCKFLYKDNEEEIKEVLTGILDNHIEFDQMKKTAMGIGIRKFSYREISQRAIAL